MTSMLCRKEPGGQVLVHDSEMAEDLTVATHDKTHTLMMLREKTHKRDMLRPNTTPSPTRSISRNMDSGSLIGQTMRVQDWLNEKTVRSLQEKSDLESKATRSLYSPLLQIESTFVKDVDEFISHKEVTNLRKKEVLHKNWSERVYKPLRKKIIEAMDGYDWPEVDRRKRELHKQYLEFTNHKDHIFLDTIDPEEYYAMALNGHRPAPIKRCPRCALQKQYSNRCIPAATELHPIRFPCHKSVEVETRLLHDPLISQGRQRSEEDRTIFRCLTGYRYSDHDIEQIKMPTMPLVPLGRHGTNCIRWLEMPLANIESPSRLASRKRMVGKFNNTTIDFEAWSRTPYNHAAVDHELHIQKKRQYSEDQKPPFPKPIIQRVSNQSVHQSVSLPEPVQRSVSFQEPLKEIAAL